MNILKQHMPEQIKRIAKVIGYAFLLGGANSWHGVSVVLTSTASGDQRKALAWAVLRSLTPDQIVAVVETVLPEGSSVPIAPLFNHMDEAAFWADMAEPDALEAYCLASFNAMLRPRQVAFLDFVQWRKAA
jgi:hypothetical protein